jgi:error-prone DNA polymerase
VQPFTHLHVATAHTTHHGTRTPEELVTAAAHNGALAAAITDRDGLYGSIRHVRACIAAGVHPIVGVELLATDKGFAETPQTITILAHGGNGGAGWAGLCRVISAAHSPRGRGRMPSRGRLARIDVDRLAGFLRIDGVVTGTVLLGAESDVGRSVAAGEHAAAAQLLERWTRRLPGGVAIEVVWHLTRPGTPRSLQHAARMLELADLAGVPAVLTNQVRYLVPEDAIAGDVLDAADQLLPLWEMTAQPNAQAWLKPAPKMKAIAQAVVDASHLPQAAAEQLLRETEDLARLCWLDPDSDLRWRQPKVPEPETIGLRPDEDPMRVLWQRCLAGVSERFADSPPAHLERVHDRLRMELGTIEGFGFATYFLTVADVVEHIRRMGVRAQARGSGAGSLVNYLLRVSIVDPLELDLLFERFLGVQRSTLPDIDVDIESARRREVYRSIVDKYGPDRVTLLAMQNRYRARGAIRDAGLALGLDPDQVDWAAKNTWRLDAAQVTAALTERPEMRDLAHAARSDPRLRLLFDLTGRLDDLPRHVSMHPCGVLLGPGDLLSITPVQPSGVGVMMSQFDKDDIDDAGLLKLDVLGVRMQSAIAHTLGEIRRVHGAAAAVAGGLPPDARYVRPDGTIQLDQVPHDDEATYANIRTTNTLGMFQIESPGQRELVGKMQPDQYNDLVADISLFRPGPMKANMVSPFVGRKHGFEPMRYLHPRFAQFLNDSYGVLIYHEHLLRIISDCMAVSIAQADEIRRAMTTENLPALEVEFRARARMRVEDGRRLFSDSQIDSIWTDVAAFGAYGFCKAHAASFSQTTYESAWLKTHFPTEFMAGLLEHDPGMYPKRLLLGEARRLGIPILPIDVNASSAHYVVEELPDRRRGIRLALTGVRSMSGAETARVLEQAPFTSVEDLYLRARPSRPTLARLAAIGALDSLAPRAQRGEIIAHVRHLTAMRRPRRDAQELSLTIDPGSAVQSGAVDPSPSEQLAAELAILGMEIGGHVLDPFRPMLDEMGVTAARDLLSLPARSQVLVAGIRVATQTPPMRNGGRVVFISVDDGTGLADATFFDEAQQATGPVLFGTSALIIAGTTRRTGARGLSVEATRAWDLRDEYARWVTYRAAVS